VLAAVGLILAIALGSGGGSDKTAARTTKTSARTTSTAAAQSTPATTSPAALDAQGSALIAQGKYTQAIEVLTRAVQAGRSTPCTNPPTQACLSNFAYPLFNLAHAYRLAGQPAQAIPLLNERLQIANQQDAVRQELAAAQAAAGVLPKGKQKKAKKAKGKD
jgi:Flp pilus assembly protein TadD